MRTAELEVRAQLSPFRLAFYDRGGRLISKDSDTLGTAWDGARVRSWKWMPPDEHYFGLGEKAGPLDKRGHAYVMWNTDAYGWEESTDPLYETIPFFIGLRAGRAYGILFDNTWRSSFDMGAESPEYYSFGAEGGDINYYFFYGPEIKKMRRHSLPLELPDRDNRVSRHIVTERRLRAKPHQNTLSRISDRSDAVRRCRIDTLAI